MNCIFCSSSNVNAFTEFPNIKRVTSDAKPWAKGGKLVVCNDCKLIQKVVDNILLEEIESIYKNYEVYHQSEGEEQAVFNKEGVAQKRSQAIIDFILKSKAIEKKYDQGSVLDFGCGNGEFLKTISSYLPKCELFGSDLSDKYKSELESIPNFKELYSSQNKPERKFDLITLIHTLEHLINPFETLSFIRKSLKENGVLFIQVPNVIENPFDILIADHITHLMPDNLLYILSKAGFDMIDIKTDIVSKEISVIATPGTGNVTIKNAKTDLNFVTKLLNEHFQFINQIIKNAKKLKSNGEFGIFGTSISATWLYNYCPEVKFFLDEDPNRVGKTLFDKPIYSPTEMYDSDIPIIFPMSQKIAKSIIDRHFIYKNEFIIPKKNINCKSLLEENF